VRVAVSFSGGGRDDVEVVRRMLHAQALDTRSSDPRPPEAPSPEARAWNAWALGGAEQREAHALAVHGGAIGWVHTADLIAPFPLVRRCGASVLVVTGTPIACRGSLSEILDRVVEGDSRRATELLTELDGGFAALFWSAAECRLTVVTDAQGMQPLYVARSADGLVLATDQKGVWASGAVDVTPDAAGWGAFLSFHHAIGDRTLVERVHRVEPGAVLEYDSAARRQTLRLHWRWPAPAPARTPADVDTGRIVAALRECIEGYRAYGRAGMVLMSGGFDSRLVVSLLKRAEFEPSALIVRHRDELGDADGRYAVRAVRRLGVPHEVATPAGDYYSSAAYRRYLHLSEGSNTSLGLFIAQVSAYVTPERGAVWEGIAPNIMKRLERNPTNGGFEAYLARACRGRASRDWRAAATVFAPDWLAEMDESFGRLLREETAKYSDDEYGVTQFSARNRARFRLGTNPYKVYAANVLTFTPGMTRAFFDAVGGLRGAAKEGNALMLRLFRENFPDALDVPFCSGGKLVSARGTDAEFGADLVLGRLVRSRYVHRAMRALGYRPFAFDLARARRELLETLDVDDPRLNGAAVRSLLAVPDGEDPVREQAKLHLFYWHVGRLLQERPGELLRPSRRGAGVA
jgi:hypothetical protein